MGQHSFKRFSAHFYGMDERSVCRLISTFNAKPHRNLSFFSIQGEGVQTANTSVHKLCKFVQLHGDLEYVKLSYFTGINALVHFPRLITNLLRLPMLSFLALG